MPILTDSAASRRPGPGPAAHSRRRRLAVLTAVACLFAAGLAALSKADLLPAFRRADPSLDSLMNSLASAVGSQRFSEGRLVEPFHFAGAVMPARGKATAVDAASQIEALRIINATQNDTRPRALRAAGVAHLVLGETDRAVDTFEQAIEVDVDDLDVRVDLSGALLSRWKRGGQPFDAVRVLDETGFVLAKRPQSPEALFNQALALEDLGTVDAAIARWRSYLEHDRSSSWANEAHDHLSALLTSASRATGDADGPPAAQMVAENPFDVYAAVEGRALPEWAAATLAGGDMDITASHRLASALAASGKDGYPAVLTDAVLRSRGWPDRKRALLAEAIRDVFAWRALVDDGRYVEAEPLGRRASSALREVDVDPSEAELEIAYSDIAATRIAPALARLDPLQQHARERGYWRIAAKAERLRALAAMLATRVAEAQTRYQDALALAERSGDVELEALLHSYLGEAFELQGDMLSSWSHFVPALQAVPRYRTMRQRFQTLNGAATAATNAGLYHAALVFAETLLAATRGWNNPEGQISGRLDAARAMAELSVGDHGRQYVEEAAALLPKLAARPQAQQRLGAEVAVRRAYAFAGHDDAAALQAVDDAIGFFGQSVRIRLAELLLQRGRIHLRLNAPDAALDDWRRGIAIVEDQRPSLRDEFLRVSRTAAVWDLYTEMLRVARSDARQALDIAERAHARELLHSLGAADALRHVTLEEWQRALTRTGGEALVYAQLPERLLVWHVTASDVELVEHPISAIRIRQAVNGFLNHLDAASGSADAAMLSRALLPSGLRLDPARPLVIVPDGDLHRVPFAALPVPASTKRLVEAATPIVAPSLTTFSLASQARGPGSRRSALAVGVSAPAPAHNLPALPNADAEASTVASLYGQHQVIVGQSVTKAVVLDQMLAHSVIHFAGHALLNPLFPLQSQLVLRDGEAISAGEIASLKLQRGTIAVLGACDTALGRTFNGEGPISLVRSFLAAGASSVVAALWPVQDDDAARLLKPLHQRLAAGETLASSLAAAQRELIQAGHRTSAWAGFTVIGGSDQERMR